MPAFVQPMKWGSDPDKNLATPSEEVKEVLVGDGKEIIGSLPDIGAVESATIFETTYYGDSISLGEVSEVVSDKEEIEEVIDVDKLAPQSIYTTLLKKYGDSFLKWEPETLRVVIKDDFQIENLPDTVWEAIQATRVAGAGVTWNSYLAFEKAALAISGQPVHPGFIQHVSVEEMAELYKLMTSIDPEGELSDEVDRYIAARMFADNYLYCGNVFPNDIQQHLFTLGTSRELTNAVHEKVNTILNTHNENTISLSASIAALTHSMVDIQVARYISLL